MSADALASAPAAVERRSWTLLILLCVAQFMVIIDMTVVNVALPSIGRTLGFASAADLQWVVTAYVLLSGGLVLIGGRSADLLGRRRVLLSGLALFTAASLGSGLAPSPLALIVFRALQGAGAAMLTPAALSVIATTYTGSQRARALATWGAIGAAGAAAGVLLGGALTGWLGWRAIFFVNVPVGAVAWLLAARTVPAARTAPGRIRELDLPGAATLVAGLVLLVYAVESAATRGWGSPVGAGALVLAAVMLVAFRAVESRAVRPLVPGSVWRIRSLIAGVGVMFGATATMGGAFFLSSLYLQRVLGLSPLEAGLAFLPFTLVIVVAAHLGPHLIQHLGTRWMAALGLLVIAVGSLLLARAPAGAGYLAGLLPGFLTIGLGLGLTFVAVPITVMADVDADRAGLASGLMTTGHELGGAMGVAVLSAIATIAASGSATGYAPGYHAGLIATAIIAALLAVGAALAVPGIRPPAGSRVHLH